MPAVKQQAKTLASPACSVYQLVAMKSKFPTVLAVVFCVVSRLLAGELPEEAKKLQAPVQVSLSACRDQVLAEQMTAMIQYTNALARAADAFRKAGDLDGVLALTEELKRCSKAGNFPETDEAGINEAVKSARQSYRAAVARAREKSVQEQKAIVEHHIEDLEALKKRLTVDARIEDAVAVKEYIASLKDEIEKKVPGPAVTPGPREDMVACPLCSGTGKKSAPCSKCSGSGLCQSCDGSGLRKAMMMGSSDRMPCIACMKTGAGKCSQCSGKGVIPGVQCDACEGSGKVSAGKAQSLKKDRTPMTGSSDVPRWAYYNRGNPGDKTVDRGNTMKTVFDSGDTIAVDLASVLLKPESYRGKVCRSVVYFRYADRGYLQASVKPSGGNSVEFTPYSEEESGAAYGIGKALKYDEQIVIFYGVLDAGRYILFRAVPARKGT